MFEILMIGVAGIVGVAVIATAAAFASGKKKPQNQLDKLTETLKNARVELNEQAGSIAATKRSIESSKDDLRILHSMLDNARTLMHDDDVVRNHLRRIVEEELEIKNKTAQLERQLTEYRDSETVISELQQQAAKIESEAKTNQRRLDMSKFRMQAANVIAELKEDNAKLLNESIDAAAQTKSREFDPDRPYVEAVKDLEVEERLRALKGK